MKKLFLVLLLTLPGCARNACVNSAQNTWRAAVLQCATEGKNAEECELDRLTAERKVAEEGCIK